MKSTIKVIGIVLAAVIAISLFAFFAIQNVQNKAIVLEEQIEESYSGLQNTYKRRIDLFYNLADCLMSYNAHEANTLKETIQARKNDIQMGDGYQEIKTIIQATAEAYPQLQASANYQTYMTELSTTENQILQYRNNYNSQIKNYNRYVRQFPTRWFLSILGYETIEYTYLQYSDENLADAPQNLLTTEK